MIDDHRREGSDVSSRPAIAGEIEDHNGMRDQLRKIESYMSAKEKEVNEKKDN